MPNFNSDRVGTVWIGMFAKVDLAEIFTTGRGHVGLVLISKSFLKCKNWGQTKRGCPNYDPRPYPLSGTFGATAPEPVVGFG